MALAETTTVETEGDLEGARKALASDKRLKILDWLKDVQAYFPPQEPGDPVTEGACNLLIVEKLGVSQPTGSRHLKVLVDTGLVVATRRKGWTYYRRDEDAIAAVAERMRGI